MAHYSRPDGFNFLPAKFLADTDHLTPQEVGFYIRMLCHLWLNRTTLASFEDTKEQWMKLSGATSIDHDFAHEPVHEVSADVSATVYIRAPSCVPKVSRNDDQPFLEFVPTAMLASSYDKLVKLFHRSRRCVHKLSQAHLAFCTKAALRLSATQSAKSQVRWKSKTYPTPPAYAAALPPGMPPGIPCLEERRSFYLDNNNDDSINLPSQTSGTTVVQEAAVPEEKAQPIQSNQDTQQQDTLSVLTQFLKAPQIANIRKLGKAISSEYIAEKIELMKISKPNNQSAWLYSAIMFDYKPTPSQKKQQHKTPSWIQHVVATGTATPEQYDKLPESLQKLFIADELPTGIKIYSKV